MDLTSVWNSLYILLILTFLHLILAENDKKYFLPTGIDITYGLKAPVIDSSSRTNQPFSYDLKWTQETENNNLTFYKIRYRKDTYPDKNYDDVPWTYLSIFGNLTSCHIVNLEPSSLYQVEMVAIGNNQLSQLLLSSFRTGVDYSAKQNEVPVSVAKTTTIQNKSRRIRNNHKNKKKHKKDKSKIKGASFSKLPEPPTSLTVTSTSQSSISLRWNPRSNGGSPIIKYYIQMRVSNGPEKTGWKTIKKTLTADTKNCEVTGLKRGLPYKFRVIAINSFGESKPSQSTGKRLAIVGYVGLTKAPEIETVHMINTSTISVAWKYANVPSSIVNGYTIAYWSAVDDRKEEIVKDPSVKQVNLDGFKPGKRYFIRMLAYNIQSESASSDLKSFLMPHINATKEGPSIINAVNHNSTYWNKISLDKYNLTTTKPDSSRYNPQHNVHARAQVTQRDIAFVIAGGVTAFIVIILVISGVVYHKSIGHQKKMQKEKHGDRYYPQEQVCNGERCNLNSQGNCEGLYTQKYSCSSCPGTTSPSQYSQTSSYCPSFDQNQRSNIYYQQYSGYNVPTTWVRGWNGDGNFCHIVNGKQNNSTKNMVTANSQPQCSTAYNVNEDQNLLVSKGKEPTEIETVEKD